MALNGGCSLCYMKPSCSVHPPGQILIASAPSLSVSVKRKIPGKSWNYDLKNYLVLCGQMPDIQFSPSSPACIQSFHKCLDGRRVFSASEAASWAGLIKRLLYLQANTIKTSGGMHFLVCFELPLPFSTQECEKT